MVYEIEWLRGAQEELDAEIAYVLGEFGLFAARKAYQQIKTNLEPGTWNLELSPHHPQPCF